MKLWGIMMPPYEFYESTDIDTTFTYESTIYTYIPDGEDSETASLSNNDSGKSTTFLFERQIWSKDPSEPYTITKELALEMAKIGDLETKIGIMENLTLNSEVTFEKGALKELLKSPTLKEMDL